VGTRELVSTSANRNSFQAAMNTNTPVAMIPPMASGSMMRTNTPSSLQPSMIAASRSSGAISLKKLRSSQIANGRLNAVKMMIST
jgi:hypothetical protein